MWITICTKGVEALSVVTHNDRQQMTDLFAGIDVRNASSSKPRDKPMIMGWIDAVGTALGAINTGLEKAFFEVISRGAVRPVMAA